MRSWLIFLFLASCYVVTLGIGYIVSCLLTGFAGFVLGVMVVSILSKLLLVLAKDVLAKDVLAKDVLETV